MGDKVTRRSLTPSQRRTVEIIERVGFGRIEQLCVRGGDPCYAQPPHVVEEVRLVSEPECRPDRSDGHLTLQKEFVSLFNELRRVQNGMVAVEIRHSLPVRLSIDHADGGLVR